MTSVVKTLLARRASLLSGKSQEKRHRNSHQDGAEHKPPGQRNPNNRKHNEAHRDKDAGELGIGVHDPERTRVAGWDAMLHDTIVALSATKIQSLTEA